MKKEIRTLVLYRLNRADESLEEAKKFISSIKNIIG
jgi:pyruvate-formate lyase-activating enzyme